MWERGRGRDCTTNGTGDLTLAPTAAQTLVRLLSPMVQWGYHRCAQRHRQVTITGSNIVFEGATADDHETTFAVTDPTADRTIAFPDADGTVALSADVSSIIPAGTVLVTARTAAPTGYVLCHGLALNTFTYKDLHAAITNTYGGTAYNAGVTDQSGVSTTFNVPDIRGRVIAGQDDMGGSSADRLTNVAGDGLNAIPLGDGWF